MRDGYPGRKGGWAKANTTIQMMQGDECVEEIKAKEAGRLVEKMRYRCKQHQIGRAREETDSRLPTGSGGRGPLLLLRGCGGDAEGEG
jgi:hypothetical protein